MFRSHGERQLDPRAVRLPLNRPRGSLGAALARPVVSALPRGRRDESFPTIFSRYHQLPREVRRAFGAEPAFDLTGERTDPALLFERLRSCTVSALEAGAADALESWCHEASGTMAGQRKDFSHISSVPTRNDFADDLGNWTYKVGVECLRILAPSVIGRELKLPMWHNEETSGDHVEAVIGMGILSSGTRWDCGRTELHHALEMSRYGSRGDISNSTIC